MNDAPASRAWMIIALISGLCAAAGCGPPTVAQSATADQLEMPAIPTADGAWQQLSVYLAPSLIAAPYRGPLLGALGEAGVQVVGEEGGPGVVTVQLDAGAPLDMKFTGSVSPQVKQTLRLDATVFYDGTMVERLSAVHQLEADAMSLMAATSQSQEWLAREVVLKLLGSEKVAALASRSPAAPGLASTPTKESKVDGLVAGTPQAAAHVFVVGIESYRDLPAPTGARADALAFAEVARTTFGVTNERLRVALDDRASAADIRRGLKWLADTTPAGGRAYFYFSGHGAPDPSSGASYLVPYDGDPLALDETTLSLGDVMSTLGGGKATETLVVLDSCFSGAGGRSVLAKGTRPLVRVKEPRVPGTIALLTAASGAEISGPTEAGDRGLFTTHVVDGIGRGHADVDGDSQITLAELMQWLEPRVSRDAKAAGREQHPGLSMGSTGKASRFVVAHGIAK